MAGLGNTKIHNINSGAHWADGNSSNAITLGVAIAKLKANNLLKAAGYCASKLLICSLSACFVAHYFELPPIATSIF